MLCSGWHKETLKKATTHLEIESWLSKVHNTHKHTHTIINSEQGRTVKLKRGGGETEGGGRTLRKINSLCEILKKCPKGRRMGGNGPSPFDASYSEHLKIAWCGVTSIIDFLHHSFTYPSHVCPTSPSHLKHGSAYFAWRGDMFKFLFIIFLS